MLESSVMLSPPLSGDVWFGLTSEALPVTSVAKWVLLPRCGASVVFTGTTRNQSPGRPGVDLLEYEAYETQVIPRMDSIHTKMRSRWEDLGRVVLLHRVGEVPVCEVSVIVAVSAPHRKSAFAAAEFGIDTLKVTVPIWKRERWQGGWNWAVESQHLVDSSLADLGQVSAS